MKLRRGRGSRRGRIEIIPMIDVMFFLLVTFMLASLSMQSLNSITVNLPQGDAPNLQHKEPVALTITKDSRIFLDKTQTTLATMAFALKSMLRGGADQGVVVERGRRRARGYRGRGYAPGATGRGGALSDRGQARMNDAFQTASPFLDEPWRRLVWIAPLSVAIWVGLLLAFALMLKQTAPPLPELKPIEARIVELPPTAGLQGGGTAAPHPAAPAVPKPKPRPQVEVGAKRLCRCIRIRSESARRPRRRSRARARKRPRNRTLGRTAWLRVRVTTVAVCLREKSAEAEHRDSAATAWARGRSMRQCRKFPMTCARWPLMR